MITWDVEVTLRVLGTGEELDYLSMPYKSEQFEDLIRRCATWFPLKAGCECLLVVRNRMTGGEFMAPITFTQNKMQTRISVDGEKVRPRDAMRVLMGKLSPGSEALVDKGCACERS